MSKYGRGVYQIECKNTDKQTFNILPHQEKIMNYFVDKFSKEDFRGMLLYHVLGSGKTCTSVSIAIKLISEDKIDKVYIFSPGSLKTTWVEQYCKKCGVSKYTDKFIFITYNYNFFGSNKRKPQNDIIFTDKTLIIIDESHNFINSVKNEAKICTKLYRLILDCKSKILLLSGTPVYRDIAEFWFIASILKPNIFGKKVRYNSKREDIGCKQCIFTNHQDFRTMFEDGSKEKMNKLKEYIGDFISYFEGDETTLPKIIEHEPIKIHASKHQLISYCNTKITEDFFTNLILEKFRKTESKEKVKLLETLKIIANKKIFTRRISNCYYPSYLSCLKDTKQETDNPIEKLENEYKSTKKLLEETREFHDIMVQEILQRHYKIVLALRDLRNPIEKQYNETFTDKLTIEINNKDIEYLEKRIKDIEQNEMEKKQKQQEKNRILKMASKFGEQFEEIDILFNLKEAVRDLHYEYNIYKNLVDINFDNIDTVDFENIEQFYPYYEKSFSLYKILEYCNVIAKNAIKLNDENNDFVYEKLEWDENFIEMYDSYNLEWQKIEDSSKIFSFLNISEKQEKEGMTLIKYLRYKIKQYKENRTLSEKEKLIIEYAKKYFEENIKETNVEIINEYNFYYQKNQELDQELDQEIKYIDTREKEKYKYDIKEKFYNYGWICDQMLQNQELLQYCPKIIALILKIISQPGKKHVVYSFFKNKSGVILIKNLFEKCINKTILTFTGDQKPNERERILANFNSETNIRGNEFPVLLITDAGSEGINLLEVREYHILEYSPVYNKISQAIGRARRYGSHNRLPQDERTINVWYYWTVWPDNVVLKIPTLTINNDGNLVVKVEDFEGDEKMIDQILYEKGIESKRKIDIFLNILKESSIERN